MGYFVTWLNGQYIPPNINPIAGPRLGPYVAVLSQGTSRVLVNSRLSAGFVSGLDAGAWGWRSVEYSPKLNLFCAVGVDTVDSTVARVATSVTGRIWDQIDVSHLTCSPAPLTWDPVNEVFAMGLATCGGSNNNRVATSPDGVTWTQRSVGSNFPFLFLKTDGAGIILGGGAGGSNTIIFSSDGGINWTLVDAINSATSRGIAFNPNTNRWLQINAANNVVRQASGDLTDWEEIAADVFSGGSDTMRSVDYSPLLDLYVAVGVGQRLYVSSDGVNWTQTGVTHPFTGTIINVRWLPKTKVFVACAFDAPTMGWSRNGLDWFTLYSANDDDPRDIAERAARI